MSILWWNDPDLGHCFIVPLAALWIIWRERHSWIEIPPEPTWWGLPVLLLGAAMQAAAVLGVGVFTESVAFLVSITGAVLALGGFRFLKAWAFPLALLVFMLPKLVAVYNQVTLPLQLLATRLAALLLSIVAAGVVRDGNVLNVGGHLVEVTEACNGLRYLLSLGFVGALFGYVADTKIWIRVTLLVAAVPLAIAGNALRVAAAGYVPALDAGTLHEVAGASIFALCVVGLILLRVLLQAVPERRHV
jgi:exosortase